MNPPGRWKVLVVDEYSQKLLGSVLRQFDILEENVSGTLVLHEGRLYGSRLTGSDRVDHAAP